LYYLKYGPLELATVRPETTFGDTGVAVNPRDERYRQYIGKEIAIETLLGPRTLKVIADDAVDQAFGTGVVKITPAHDATDFEMWQRHKDEIPGPNPVIGKDGRLNEKTGPYESLKVAQAREKIVVDMKERGLITRVDESYTHNVAVCYKCNSVIEPLIVPQWYIAMTKPLPDGRPSLRDMAVQAVKNKEVSFVSERFENQFMSWMENLRDWPISRQIWWGIPIPVKFCSCGEIIVDTEDTVTTCPTCPDGTLTRDPDTFDTWFSSGQWPYATLQASGPNDFETYFPTHVMETGWDILFFWVARMIMLSYYRTGQRPFKTVYLHGLVRDAKGQKISKSKGNAISPQEMIDKYGTDAVRVALVFSTSAGNDIPLAEDKIRGMKHFANKLWNIARFVLMSTEPEDLDHAHERPEPMTDADRIILEKLDATVAAVTHGIDTFALHESIQQAYQFTWDELARIYLEASKSQLMDTHTAERTRRILIYCLVTVLKLLHPFAPFITEELWGRLYGTAPERTLMIQRWPV
jgi:valyl-tRNA synthetase